MAGGTGVIRDAGGKADGRQASVSNGALHVQGNVGVIGPVTVAEPVSVDDNGGSLTVDGAVTIQEPLSVDDNAGSLTVDAPAATPVAVRLFDGAAAALGTLVNPVYILDAVEVFPLSNSVNGRPITMAAGFANLHTVPALMRDVLTIYASNNGPTDAILSLRLGGAAGDQMEAFLPARETVVALHEIPLDATVVVQGAVGVGGPVRVVGRVRRRLA